MTLNCHCGPPVKVRGYGDKGMHGILAQVHLIVGHEPILCYFPCSECIIRIDILSSWQNLYTVSLTCEVRAILELPLPGKIIN